MVRIPLLVAIILVGALQAQPLSGSYTIGGNNPDFATVQSAVDSLIANGVGGPVTFNLRAGVYEENSGAERALHIPDQISGAAGNRIVTFRADVASGADSSNVILQRTGGPNEDGWVAFVRSNYITFDHLTFQYAHGDTGIAGIQTLSTMKISSPGSSSDSITIRNCRFLSSSTSIPSVALLLPSVGSHLTIDNCRIERTSQGIIIPGGLYQHVSITNNILRKLSYYFHPNLVLGHGIAANGVADAVISNNDLDYEGGHTGIVSISAIGGGITIDGNRIRNVAWANTPTYYTGIQLINQSSGRSTITNNMLGNIQRTGNGLYIKGADVAVYHNSVVMSPGLIPAGQSQTAVTLGSCSDVDFSNNIFMAMDGGFSHKILHTGGSVTNVTFDHNLLYSAPFSLYYDGVQYDSLAAWQASGHGINSQSFLSEFVSDYPYDDLHLGLCSPGDTRMLGTAIPEVTHDFDGQPRDPQTPYIGADETSQTQAEPFSQIALMAINDEALSITSGDLDNDGDDDLAVVNNNASGGGSEDISIFWNDGSGNFSGPNHITMGTEPVIVKVFDIDNDGLNDLIATTDWAPVVRWGTGGGNFDQPFNLPPPVVNGQEFGAVHDIEFFAGHHLLQTHFGTVGVDSGRVSICWFDDNLRNFRYTQLGSAAWARAGMNPSDIVTADFDNDGELDFVVNDYITGKTGVFRFNLAAPGTFYWEKVQELQIASGSHVIHPNIATGDIDVDGDIDVVIGEWSSTVGSDSLVFLRNDGSGFFSVDYISMDARRPSRTFSIFDYESDGDDDIVSASALNDVVLYLNNGFGQFSIQRGCQSSEFGSTPLGLTTGLFDGDGSPDVALLTISDQVATMNNLLYIPSQTAFNFPSANLNLPVLDLIPTNDTLSVSLGSAPEHGNDVVLDVKVGIDSLYHTRDGDLELFLHHDGISDTLIFRAGGNGQNFLGTILDDLASRSVSGGSAPFSGSYRPHRPLSTFVGSDPQGDWVLEVFDSESGETGVLQGWSLELTVGSPTGILQSRPKLAETFQLRQNYPNPFNPATTIEFELLTASVVTLEIYDILGRHVVGAYRDTPLRAGAHKYNWNATDAAGNPVASGMYFYRLVVGDQFAKTKKMLLVR